MDTMQAVDKRMTRLEEENRKLLDKLRKLVDVLVWVDEETMHEVDYTGKCIKACLSCRVKAALKAAKES